MAPATWILLAWMLCVITSLPNLLRFLLQLKCDTSSGVDGISAEHLKCAVNTNLPTYLSILLKSFRLVPDTFCKGVLVPITKNLTLIHVMQQVIGLSVFLKFFKIVGVLYFGRDVKRVQTK